ncbi:hypothetical protein PGQ11_014752 [Apiospora arundinis]|uniref:Uncharacterized protein n=1 Tax=Apiospora arundinis TaxID=335852 RepID=A0ABR2HT52_9PEZI
MASLLSSFWRTEAPKTAVGVGCMPGEAAKGTIQYMVEREIRDKLDEDPDFDRLKEMKAYIEAMDFLKRDGSTVDVYFIDECIKNHKQRGPASIISGASRTTGASDVGSFSPSRHTIGSATDSNAASELNRHQIPFQLMTTDQRWRTVIARKTTSGSQNYISPRIAGQSGFPSELDARIEIKLSLLGEQMYCVLQVREMDQEMLLAEALVVKFSGYRADYQLDDYFNESTVHESTEQSSSTATGLPQGPRNRNAMSSMHSRDDRSEAGMSNASNRNGNEDYDREHHVMLDAVEHLIQKDRYRMAGRKMT